MPPLLADFTHARVCKPFCEKFLTLPGLIHTNRLSFEKSYTNKNRLKIRQRLYTGIWGIQPILFCPVTEKIGGNL